MVVISASAIQNLDDVSDAHVDASDALPIANVGDIRNAGALNILVDSEVGRVGGNGVNSGQCKRGAGRLCGGSKGNGSGGGGSRGNGGGVGRCLGSTGGYGCGAVAVVVVFLETVAAVAVGVVAVSSIAVVV